MPGTFGTTTRNALRWLKGTSLVSDIDEGFQALAEDVDTKMASYLQDTLAKRPPAGQPNRFFKATDGLKQLFHDTGTVWETILREADGLLKSETVNFLNESATSGFTREPSATRPTLVIITALATGTAQLYKVEYNGASAGHPKGYLWVEAGGADSCMFYVPPGIKYTLTRLSAGPDCKLEVQEFSV